MIRYVAACAPLLVRGLRLHALERLLAGQPALGRAAPAAARPEPRRRSPRRTCSAARSRPAAGCRGSARARRPPRLRRSAGPTRPVMRGCVICSRRRSASASLKTIRPSPSRSRLPSARSTPAPKASTISASPGVPGATTSRAIASESTITAPCAASIFATVLLPAPMPAGEPDPLQTGALSRPRDARKAADRNRQRVDALGHLERGTRADGTDPDRRTP